jgi:DNA-binding MarR family transcriptional regulator
MMNTANRTLGTLLRHLIEKLDCAVELGYRRAGLDYSPRYTPIIRACIELGSGSIKVLARHVGMTHSAVSQTVTQLVKAGLVQISSGADAREHIVSLTTKATQMLPALQEIWRATNAAASELDAELLYPLSLLIEQAIEALELRPFSERREAHQRLLELNA